MAAPRYALARPGVCDTSARDAGIPQLRHAHDACGPRGSAMRRRGHGASRQRSAVITLRYLDDRLSAHRWALADRPRCDALTLSIRRSALQSGAVRTLKPDDTASPWGGGTRPGVDLRFPSEDAGILASLATDTSLRTPAPVTRFIAAACGSHLVPLNNGPIPSLQRGFVHLPMPPHHGRTGDAEPLRCNGRG